MSFLMPQQALSSAIEKIINQALSLNYNPNTKLTILEGKSLSVLLHELGFTLCFNVCNEQILVTSIIDHKNNCDCKIDTSLSTLWQLKQEQQLTSLIKQDKLDLQGDIKIAQQFAALFENIDIDWQSELAKHIGDVATYKLSQSFNALKNKATFAKTQIQADASEWLIHEKRLIVTQAELTEFYQAVHITNLDVDKLSTRIEKLTQALTTK